MAWNKTNGFALLLIGCGVLILLDKIGLGIGGLLSFIFPFVLILFGYIGIKNGRQVLGWIMVIFGLILLFGKLSGLIGWLIAIGLIVYGFNMLKKRNSHV